MLAEHYRSNAQRLILDYREKIRETKRHDNKLVSAALGEEQDQLPIEDRCCLMPVKFPSPEDELESTKLFRRCMGPLAATLPGREKLINDGKQCYGDGRPIHFCRVAGCQLVHSDDAEEKKFLCDWHHSIIEGSLQAQVEPKQFGRRKPKRMADQYTKSRKATKKFHESQACDTSGKATHADNKAEEYEGASDTKEPEKLKLTDIPAPSNSLTVTAPPGELGLSVGTRARSRGTFVIKVRPHSVLADRVFPGYQITAIDEQNVTQSDAMEVKAILKQKAASERRLTFMRCALPEIKEQSVIDGKEDAASSKQPETGKPGLSETGKPAPTDDIAVETLLEPTDAEC